jgi:hypothetical protein
MKRLSRSNLIRRWWKGGLGLALGFAVSSASAEDIQWRAAADAPPVAPRAPAVTILAPVPIPPSADPLRKVSYSAGEDAGSRIIFRAQMSDAPKMLPVGAPEGPEDPPRKKTEVLPAPHVVSGPVTSHPAYPAYAADCGTAPAACNADGCGRFCMDDCCGPPSNCFWASGEYLLWWVKGQTLPPLVTVGNPADDIPGAIGQPGTAIIYGGGRQSDDSRSGARLRVGWWFDDEHTVGIDGSAFFLGQQTKTFTASSFGTPALFRPFLNSGFVFDPGVGFVRTPPFQDAEAVAFPGALAGSVTVRQTSRLWGYDANLRTNILNGCCNGYGWTLDGYAGFRSLELDESLEISENLASLLPAAPGSIAVYDKFKTDNTFYGGQIGLEGELRRGRWFLDLNARLAMGDMHEVVSIAGQTVTGDASGVHVSNGGLLAQGTNIGNYSRDRFALIPELGLNFGYQVTDCVRLFVGYNLLYVSTVVRPADQIDRAVNPTQIPRLGGSTLTGPANPAFPFHGTDFYAQGLNFGVEFRW